MRSTSCRTDTCGAIASRGGGLSPFSHASTRKVRAMSRSAAGKVSWSGRTRGLAFGLLAAFAALGCVLLAVEPTQAAFPGKNGKVVFASDRLTPDNPIPEGKIAPDREIFVSSASGAGVVQLTHNERDDLSPAFSRDGKRIVFTSDRENFTYEVFVMGASGAGERNVTTDDPSTGFAQDADPAFSPSGGLIAFASDRTTGEGVDNPDGDREIFTIKPDGTGLRQLTHNAPNESGFGANDQVPVFSPSGKKIAFSNNRDQIEGDFNTEIYTMDANGGNEVNLTRNPAGDGRPDWSPDGKKIVFHSSRDDVSSLEIYAMDADGSNPTRLTANTVTDSSPAFSPDGRQIAFHSRREGNTEIYRMRANGSQQTMVTDTFAGDNFRPDWQPLQPRR